MNLQQLKRNVGFRVRLVPPAYHLDSTGEPLSEGEADWTIMAVTAAGVEVNTDEGAHCLLGSDHIRSFYTDPQGTLGGQNRGFIQLVVQLYVQGLNVSLRPCPQPGVSVPPPADPALKARATFVPALARIVRHQIHILDRVVVNYGTTASELNGIKHSERPDDTWMSLKPPHMRPFTDSLAYGDLRASDAELLAEFYDAVAEINDMVERWEGNVPLTDYNAWNVLMHKVEHSVRNGTAAVQKFCPFRVYDATMPAGGSLVGQAQRVLELADVSRRRFIERREALAASAVV